MAQMTQFGPLSSKITLVSSSDENSTFPHFWHGRKKSWKNENENTQDPNRDLKSTWKSESRINLEDQNENSEIEIWDHSRNCDFENKISN